MSVGFIGLGNMGYPMSERLLDAGHQLVVHDIRTEVTRPLADRQARVVGSAREVADAAEVVFASLPSLDAYRSASVGGDGIIEGKTAKIFVNLGTVGTPLIRDIAAKLSASGIATIDCPVSGGPPGAAAGTLSVMVSGPEAAFRQVEPMLAQLGPVTYAGAEPGLAQSLKLVNNILTAVALTATSEAFAMGVKAGLDPEVILQAVNAGSGRNSATLDKFPSDVVTHKYKYGAALDILIKDIDLAMAEGEALGVPMLVSQSARQLLRLVRADGGGTQDITRVAERVSNWAGAKIPKTR